MFPSRHAARVLMASLLAGLLILPSFPAVAHSTSAGPVLTVILATEAPSNQLLVSGEGFTPGGLAYFELRDTRDGRVHHHFWAAIASTWIAANGSIDPSVHNLAPGVVSFMIPIVASTTYGPNGSQDPANGFDGDATSYTPPAATEDGVTITRHLACEGHLVARAYDRSAEMWTLEIGVTGRC